MRLHFKQRFFSWFDSNDIFRTRISKLPPLTQGMIYSEIPGKPKSEIA